MNTTERVAVIGMGYVGLPLALAFARSGQRALGIDIDESKTADLNSGRPYLSHIDSSDLLSLIERGLFEASTDFSRISDCQAVIICVPTPLKKHRDPDLSYVLTTGRDIAPHLTKGCLVILESTTYPGTTEEELREVLESESGLSAGKDFFLAFSPEREDPGNPDSKIASIPKVVGGYTPACLEKACDLYRKIVDRVVPVSNCRTAEAAKLLENIFRCVNIALVNELKVVYREMGIDIWEVIDAAKTKPFGFMPFYPGPGLGGHCIPIDPYYLTWKAREFGLETKFIHLAGEINTAMPRKVVEILAEAVNQHGKALKGARILIIGLAYKADIGDIRESPTFELMNHLEKQLCVVDYHDPFVPVIPPTREHSVYAGRLSVDLTKENVSAYDCVLISTAHTGINYQELADWAQLIVDTRNVVPRPLGSTHVFAA